MQPYDTRFLNEFHAAIEDALDRYRRDLCSGTQINQSDAAATGMAFARYVGRIDGLGIALQLMQQVNDDMNGKNRKKEDRDA